MTAYRIWYMRPEWFRDGICGARPDIDNIGLSHIHLIDVSADSMDAAYAMMQAERWSPSGEARELIAGKGLGHTSMSVGDVIESDGAFHLVASVGFDRL